MERERVAGGGPRRVAVWRELGVAPAITAPEPNTWRELLLALDEAGASREELRLPGKRVAVQEYGVSNPELLSGLRERGAAVTRVPIYQWALPEDLGPLPAAVKALPAGEIDVALFTTSLHLAHPFHIAN